MNISNDVISAAVHPGILDKADRLFRNDDEGIWIELLQNARRAGATGVDVSIKEYPSDTGTCTVTVQDNGRGIDDFQKLLTLGSSGWAAETQAREDPAGMGFFSLCRFTVEVHSGYGFVKISPAVFLGKAEAMVEQASEFMQGTRIRFTRASTKSALSSALERVTEFCPLVVRLDGISLPQHDFLEGALHRELIDGIEVGFATQFTHHRSSYRDMNWNFYGARIEHAFTAIDGFLPPEKITPVSIYARFNVLETARVKLQLPDRRGIIEDDFFKDFQRKTLAGAYRFFQTLAQHALPFKNWQEAQTLGVGLPEAAYLLSTWHASPQDEGIHPMFGYSERRLLDSVENMILVERDLPNEHTLEGSLQCGATLDGALYEEKPAFAGYSWYDRLPRILSTAVFVDDIPYDEWREAKGARPDRIEIELSLEQAGAPSRTVRLPALIHVEPYDGINFVAVKESPWDNDDLAGPFSVADFLVCATFCASDDFGECDSWQTQKDAYDEDVEREVNGYFRGPRATLAAILRKAIAWEADRLANQLGVNEIRFKRQSSQQWDVELMELHAQVPPVS